MVRETLIDIYNASQRHYYILKYKGYVDKLVFLDSDYVVLEKDFYSLIKDNLINLGYKKVEDKIKKENNEHEYL